MNCMTLSSHELFPMNEGLIPPRGRAGFGVRKRKRSLGVSLVEGEQG